MRVRRVLNVVLLATSESSEAVYVAAVLMCVVESSALKAGLASPAHLAVAVVLYTNAKLAS